MVSRFRRAVGPQRTRAVPAAAKPRHSQVQPPAVLHCLSGTKGSTFPTKMRWGLLLGILLGWWQRFSCRRQGSVLGRASAFSSGVHGMRESLVERLLSWSLARTGQRFCLPRDCSYFERGRVCSVYTMWHVPWESTITGCSKTRGMIGTRTDCGLPCPGTPQGSSWTTTIPCSTTHPMSWPCLSTTI